MVEFTETAALVRKMREALIAVESSVDIGLQRRKAIADADQWLAQQRGPLTDEEIAHMWMAGYSDGSGQSMVNLFARAVERAHGIVQPAGEDKPC